MKDKDSREIALPFCNLQPRVECAPRWYFLKMKKGESGAEEEALIEEEDAPELEVRGDLQ